jgi:uncharacterized protein YcbK (DUF882 family)
MIYKPEYFTIDELVCPDVYNVWGQQAFSFFDQRLLITIDNIRQRLKKPVWINNYLVHGSQEESGLRCIRCSIVKAKIDKGELYVSAHLTGQAVDFSVEGMTAEEVRSWLISKQNLLPYPVRLEEAVNWVHLDVRDNFEGKKIVTFKA